MPYIHQSESWGRSIFPPAPVINGVQCFPLCIGHIALLGLMDIPERLQQIEDAGGALVEGLAVCSQSLEDSVYAINKGAWESLVNEVGQVVYEMPIDDGLKAFAEYLQESQEMPVYYQKQSDGGKRGSDTWMSIKTTLQSKLHMSDFEILNRPVAQCVAEYFAIAESEGWIMLQSQSDADLLQSDRHKEVEAWALQVAREMGVMHG